MNLTTQEAVDFMNKEIEDNQTRLNVNERLFDIYEGSVLKELMQALIDDLGQSSTKQAQSRAVPINILKQIINKLAQIYQNTPRRSVDPDNATDLSILEYYEKTFNINPKLNYNNELQNLFGYSFQQIVLNKGKPTTRAIPNHSFLPINFNKIDPTEANVIIVFMGQEKSMQEDERMVDIRWAWSDEQFVIFDSNGDLRPDIMAEKMDIPFETITYENPFGRIPGTYLTTSQNSLMPAEPDDILQLSLLIPVLLTDLNFAAKFQIFSILYGIDVDDENLKMSPAVFWRFKSHKGKEKPEIGSIKPEVDIDKVLTLAGTELALWLQSLGIRPGAVGKLDGNNFSSGISKIIDEADILDHQSKQTELYRAFEPEFWDTALKYMHPVWVKNRELEPKAPTALFNMNTEVITVFTKKIPVHSRGALAKDYMVEIEGGLISRKEVMRRLNPELSEKKLEEIQKEIDEEQAKAQSLIVGNTDPLAEGEDEE
jgi:hypothetical protein